MESTQIQACIVKPCQWISIGVHKLLVASGMEWVWQYQNIAKYRHKYGECVSRGMYVHISMYYHRLVAVST